VLALFAAAARHDARKPGSDAGGFVSYLQAQEVPSDTIAAHAPEGDRITVSTVTPAIGREWDLVAVVGLEEDVWPDLRLRDTLLGAGQLADLADGKDVPAMGPERRREVLEDEARTFALALTRAKREVMAVAAANNDEQPSRFFHWLAANPVKPAGRPETEETSGSCGKRVDSGPGWPFDLRGIVAEARSGLIEWSGKQAGAIDVTRATRTPAAGAARVLAVLAGLGIEGANPAEWPGLTTPSVETPLYCPGSVPVLSPSKVESLLECPLQWALTKAGGVRQAGSRADLGSLIHWLAEHYPNDGPEELRARLDERWPELCLDDDYSSRRLKTEAGKMVWRLGVYQQAHPGPLATEAEIVSLQPSGDDSLPVRLAGRIDRLEDGGDGRVRVVDFKTGAAVPTREEAAWNPQLGSYQVAVRAGLVPPYTAVSEAVLVYLSRGTKAAAELRQEPLDQADDPDWMAGLLRQCAADAAGPAFEARVGGRCRTCAVKSSCPAWPEGKQVIA
jgi:RecB family exonuclease